MGMKFCKTCGTLYTDSLGVCPKCNAAAAARAAEQAKEPVAPVDAAQRKRQWIAICLGVPCLILFLYLVIWGLGALGNA